MPFLLIGATTAGMGGTVLRQVASRKQLLRGELKTINKECINLICKEIDCISKAICIQIKSAKDETREAIVELDKESHPLNTWARQLQESRRRLRQIKEEFQALLPE